MVLIEIFESVDKNMDFHYCKEQEQVQGLIIEQGSLIAFNKDTKQLVWIIPKRDLINLVKKNFRQNVK